MSKIINRLPEIAGAFILAIGISTIISKQITADFSVAVDYVGMFIYFGVAFGVFVILKAAQIIIHTLLNKSKS